MRAELGGLLGRVVARGPPGRARRQRQGRRADHRPAAAAPSAGQLVVHRAAARRPAPALPDPCAVLRRPGRAGQPRQPGRQHPGPPRDQPGSTSTAVAVRVRRHRLGDVPRARAAEHPSRRHRPGPRRRRRVTGPAVPARLVSWSRCGCGPPRRRSCGTPPSRHSGKPRPCRPAPQSSCTRRSSTATTRRCPRRIGSRPSCGCASAPTTTGRSCRSAADPQCAQAATSCCSPPASCWPPSPNGTASASPVPLCAQPVRCRAPSARSGCGSSRCPVLDLSAAAQPIRGLPAPPRSVGALTSGRPVGAQRPRANRAASDLPSALARRRQDP